MLSARDAVMLTYGEIEIIVKGYDLLSGLVGEKERWDRRYVDLRELVPELEKELLRAEDCRDSV